MVKSMTSFGRSSSEEGKKRFFTVEMKSVNSRYLDINIRMPKSIISLEEEVRKRINESLSRGKVDVFINLKSYSDGQGVPKLNLKLAQEYLNCLKQIEDNLCVKNDVTVTQIARFPEVITMVEEEDKIDEIAEELTPLISEALEMMIKMREVVHDKGAGMVIALHDINLAMNYSDKVLMLKNGKIFAYGTPDETITEENIRAVYGVESRIMEAEGRRFILPMSPDNFEDD